MTDCKCNGTGWVKARIPAQYQHEYDGMTFGWAACDTHGDLIGDSDPPADDSQPDPVSYGFE